MKKNVVKLFVVQVFFFGIIQYSYAQTIDKELLSKEIYALNDQHQYEKSIIRVQSIIDDPNTTHYDRYNALLQKSFTYKRVFNYTEATTNLKLALEEGLKSNKKEEVKARIAVERLFIKFDLQKSEEVKELLSVINTYNLDLIDIETKAHYISLLAVMEFRANNIKGADKKLDEAIAIFEKVNPSHLPNIYTKKMLLFEALKQPEKVVKAYETGLYYALKYNSDTYKKTMYVNMWRYYKNQNDTINASFYRNLADELQFDDNSALNNRSLDLANLEKKLIADRIIKKQTKIRHTQLFLFALVVLFTAGFALLYRLFKRDKLKRISAELETESIRTDFQKLISEHTVKQDVKASVKSCELTDRQKEIIKLVKEGKTNKEIGAELFISENTVKYHLKIIYTTLEIENRLQLQR